MGVVLHGNVFEGSVLINNHIVEENLTLFLDPNNDESYAGSGTIVNNIAPEATNNGISGSLDASSMYVEGANNRNSYFRVRSDSVVQRLNFSSTISRDADDDSSTVMFYFWSNYDGTGQYSNSQAFFGGKYTNYMALRGGTNGTYSTEAETNGGDDGNHDYMANEGGAIFATGSWQSWTNIITSATSSNYYNGVLHGTTYPMANNAVHSFNKLGSSSTGTTSNDRGGDIRMGALLIYDRALTESEIKQNLDVLNRRFQD
jgi:hypothetical protein